MSARAKQVMDIGIKLALLGAALYIIWHKGGWEAYTGIFAYHWHHPQLFLTAFIFLALLNLWLDASIWQRVHRFIGELSLGRALKTNFVCYALSFITPVNSGELAGRYVMLKQQNDRRKTVFLTFWSHFPRLITKLVLGGSALILLIPGEAGFSPPIKILLLAGWNLSVLAFYLFFIRLQRWLAQFGWHRWKLENHIVKDRPQTIEKLQLLGLSSFKYLVYNLQFMALLMMWGGLQWNTEIFLAVLAFFFISALLPTFPAADFLVKGAIAIYVFRDVLANESLLLHSTLAMWMVNIALPALTGLVIIMRSNLPGILKKKLQPESRYGL